MNGWMDGRTEDAILCHLLVEGPRLLPHFKIPIVSDIEGKMSPLNDKFENMLIFVEILLHFPCHVMQLAPPHMKRDHDTWAECFTPR